MDPVSTEQVKKLPIPNTNHLEPKPKPQTAPNKSVALRKHGQAYEEFCKWAVSAKDLRESKLANDSEQD